MKSLSIRFDAISVCIRVLTFTLTIACGSLFASNPADHSVKKGVGIVNKNPVRQELVTKLNANWYYSWSGRPDVNIPEDVEYINGFDVEYVPMQYGDLSPAV